MQPLKPKRLQKLLFVVVVVVVVVAAAAVLLLCCCVFSCLFASPTLTESLLTSSFYFNMIFDLFMHFHIFENFIIFYVLGVNLVACQTSSKSL